jgi:hypothetical protein
MVRALAAVAATTAAVLALGGCGLSAQPHSAPGVLATYRAIDADAASGNYTDLCQHYIDSALLHQLALEHKLCPPFMSEHWGEFTPASKVTTSTRVSASGDAALVYDSDPPEALEYSDGQWRLMRIPRSGEHGTTFIGKLNREDEALNAAANARPSG